MCASAWPSGRSDPNPEQVFGQAFEALTGLGLAEVVMSGRVPPRRQFLHPTMDADAGRLPATRCN